MNFQISAQYLGSVLSLLKVKVAQSFLTLCTLMDCTVCGILQARVLEWVAFPFSRGSSQPRDRTQLSTLQADSLPAEPPGKLPITLSPPWNPILAQVISDQKVPGPC